MSLTIDICSLDDRLKKVWLSHLPKVEQIAQKAVKTALLDVVAPKNFRITILLANDEELQALNHKWNNINSPTDVLSFPNENGGDVAVSLERLLIQATQDNINKVAYFGWLIIHSVLHLCGFDHKKSDEAKIMGGIETAITQKAFGITPPINPI